MIIFQSEGDFITLKLIQPDFSRNCMKVDVYDIHDSKGMHICELYFSDKSSVLSNKITNKLSEFNGINQMEGRYLYVFKADELDIEKIKQVKTADELKNLNSFTSIEF